MKGARTVRRRRALPPVGERDLDILTLIGLCRFVTTAQVARDLFPSEDRARRRLRQLFDAKLVAVTLTSSTQPNLISLTKEGHDLLKGHRPELAARIRRTGIIRLSELEHHLLLVDARLYASAWGQARGAPLVRWINNPTEVPGADALIQFDDRGSVAAVAVRYERRHERGGELERLHGQVERGTLKSIWLLAAAEPSSAMPSRHHRLSPSVLRHRPIRAGP